MKKYGLLLTFVMLSLTTSAQFNAVVQPLVKQIIGVKLLLLTKIAMTISLVHLRQV